MPHFNRASRRDGVVMDSRQLRRGIAVLWLITVLTWIGLVGLSAQHVRVNGQGFGAFISATITTLTSVTANVTTANVATLAVTTLETITKDAIATTSTDAEVLTNTTAATGGATVQMSPRLRFRGNAWDTAASQTVDFFLEDLPATAATPTGTFRLGYSLNGGAITYPLSITDAGLLIALGEIRATTNLRVGSKLTVYNGVTTAGWGAAIPQAQARAVAVTNVGTASVATYTVGAADGTFEVGCNVLVTTSTNHTFSCDTTYTDESNVARTMVMPVEQLAGAFATSGLITNVTGAGPYESAVMTIRAKAATAITIRTSAGGTFTGVVYNIDGTIKQVG